MRPHRQQPTRLPCSWDSPGKNTGVGCHFLLQCMKMKSESEVAQSCPTLRHPMDCSLPGSSIHGIFQAKVLEWGAIAFSEVNPRSSYSTNLTQTLDDFKTHTHTHIFKYTPSAAAAKLLQSCPTLCDPMDCSPPGSPIPGILQARILEWVAISFSNA